MEKASRDLMDVECAAETNYTEQEHWGVQKTVDVKSFSEIQAEEYKFQSEQQFKDIHEKHPQDRVVHSKQTSSWAGKLSQSSSSTTNPRTKR